ncbi:hypothetical protein L1049_001104 [Liquidambar formosana]|uniref:F-box domain-containing protein n=1 Tax=Liquidambar formosana TaxID=63359 RepID=A0AAP0NAW9_LIQFO
MESLGGKSSSSSISSDNNISKQRKRKHTSEGVDYISNLPKTILFYILSFLTLKDCIVMSSLSRQWKDLWTHIPQLNFSELEFIAIMAKRHIHCPQSSEVPSPHNHSQCLQHSVNVVRRKFVEFVDRTLRLHSGCTLNNFRLFFHSDAHAEWTYKIDSWVRFAMTRNIKELELDFSEGRAFRPIGLAQSYELPSCNFAPKILQTLILNCCKFRTSSFRMFASLQSVSLIQVEVLDCSIGDLTSICPVLEDLSLEYCVLPKVFLVCKHDMKIKRLSVIYCITNEQTMVPIDISTPELLTLKIVGINLMKTSVRKALNLVDAILDIRQQVADSLRRNLLGSLLTNLNPCRALYLTTWCIQVLFCYHLYYFKS